MTLKDIKLLILDFDGVLAPEAKIWTADGKVGKVLSGLDGHGVAMLRGIDLPIYVLSGEDSEITAAWCTAADVVYRRAINIGKDQVLLEICKEVGASLSEVVYVGNDVSDICAMDIVGYPIAVADSHPLLLQGDYFLTSRRGGCGAVREVCDRILYSRGLMVNVWDNIDE